MVGCEDELLGLAEDGSAPMPLTLGEAGRERAARRKQAGGVSTDTHDKVLIFCSSVPGPWKFTASLPLPVCPFRNMHHVTCKAPAAVTSGCC